MVAIQDVLSEIESVSQELNTETDALNEVVEQIEARLAAARAGVSIWLDSMLAAEPVECDDETQQSFSVWQLGYSKIGSHTIGAAETPAWRIVARRATRTVTGRDYYGAELDEYSAFGDPIPLTKAPRIVRVEAAEHLESLLISLKEKMHHFVASIRKAKSLAQD